MSTVEEVTNEEIAKIDLGGLSLSLLEESVLAVMLPNDLGFNPAIGARDGTCGIPFFEQGLSCYGKSKGEIAPIVQWIEQGFPKPQMKVRFLLGAQ